MNAAEQGHLLLKQGQAKEAEAAFRRVLEGEPDHVEALNVVGLAALRDGDIDRALTLLKRAAAVDGGQALTHLHLGRAHAAAFELEAAAAAYATALAREPKLHAARLHLAELHEKRGDTMRAVMTYARALNDAQAEGRWLNAATTPAALQGAVTHAQQFVRERRLAGFAELMEPFAKTVRQRSPAARGTGGAHPSAPGGAGVSGSAPEADLPVLPGSCRRRRISTRA